MQQRSNSESRTAKLPCGTSVKIPVQYWDELGRRDLAAICRNALGTLCPPDRLTLPFLGNELLVDRKRCVLCRKSGDHCQPAKDPFVELLCLVYLLNVGPEPLTDDIVSVHDLNDAQFFKGPHDIKTQPLLQYFENDLTGFLKASERLGGELVDMADGASKLWPFPKVPIYYLLWKGDEEFEPRLSILFDRSVECHLSADAIWGLTNLVTDMLIGDLPQ